MRLIFLIITPLILFSADFITKKEHASMLYKNPRGIGCDRCHGEHGEGLLISKYKHKVKKTNEILDKELRSPAINSLSFEQFKAGLDMPKSVMPNYYLTDDEIGLLYEYVSSLKDEKPKKGNKK